MIIHEGLRYLGTSEVHRTYGIHPATARNWAATKAASLYVGGRWYIAEGAVVTLASQAPKSLRISREVKRLLNKYPGAAEAAWKRLNPEGSWSEYAKRFGGSASRARHRYLKYIQL